jgi:Cysteine-rich secretory protein family
MSKTLIPCLAMALSWFGGLGCGDGDADSGSGVAGSATGGMGVGASGSGAGPGYGGGDGCYKGDMELWLSGDTVPGNVDLGLATNPETERNPCGTDKEHECFEAVNSLRVEANLLPYTWDGDLADVVRSHAQDRSQLASAQYGSSTSTEDLGHERAMFLGLTSDYYGDPKVKFGKYIEAHELFQTGSGETAVERLTSLNAFNDLVVGNFAYLGCGEFDGYFGIAFAHQFSWGCVPATGGCDKANDCCSNECIDGGCK